MPINDFENFLNTVRYMDYEDAVSTADTIATKLEKSPGRMDRKESQLQHAKVVSFLYWIKTGKRPPGLTTQEFLELRPVCENLISKKQLHPKAREVFKKIGKP